MNWVLPFPANKPMNKREELDNMRREHARERQEIRDDEWDIRDGEDYMVQKHRTKMAEVLKNTEITPEKRKADLAVLKEMIEEIMDKREQRELDFIEQELQRHEQEAKLEAEITEEEKADTPEPAQEQNENISPLFRTGPVLTLSAEQIRKNINEKSKELTEEEQFSTILINTSDRDAIPNFKQTRRRREIVAAQSPRIDTKALKQREIGNMYKESQEQQEQMLNKKKKSLPPPPMRTPAKPSWMPEPPELSEGVSATGLPAPPSGVSATGLPKPPENAEILNPLELLEPPKTQDEPQN